MGDLIPLTDKIGEHLAATAATAVTAASGVTGMSELEHEIRRLITLIDHRRARGWTKVPYYALTPLRVLLGMPEPTTEEDPER
jgi:hypothetical protein